MDSVVTIFNTIVTIRTAVNADAARLRELRLEALTSDPAAFSADYAASAAEPIETWVERMGKYAQYDQGAIYVAATDSDLIGMVGIVKEKWPKTQHNGIIWGVFVKRDWRGHQIAEALVKDCIDWAQARELQYVKLSVITTNISAIRCYSRCGFSVYGVDPKVICFKGIYYDTLLMAYAIRSAPPSAARAVSEVMD